MGCTTPSGEAVSALVCAKTIAGILKGVATTPAGPADPGGTGTAGPGGTGTATPGGTVSTPQGEPLGELFGVNLELAGLKGQSVFLSWSIFQQAGPSHLSGSWLNNFVAYRLEATTNDDTGTLEMWIPLPRQHGPYFVRLTLTINGTGLASIDSGPFD